VGLRRLRRSHHAQAESYREIVAQCPARYLFGVTATPLDNDWRQPLLTALFGPIFHRARGKPLTPEIRAVATGWKWERQTAREKALVDTRRSIAT
jgi:hypothetical protein